MAAIKLGELLLKAKVLSAPQLNGALAEQQRWGGRLGEILVRMNILTEDMLVKALSKQLNLPSVSLDAVQSIPMPVKAKINAKFARELDVVPLQLRDDGRTLVVAMAEPQNLDHVDKLRSITRCRIVVQIAGRSSIERAFARFYESEKVPDEIEGSFKFLDSQGRTVRPSELAGGGEPLGARAQTPSAQQRVSLADVPLTRAPVGALTEETLGQLEEAQRKEVAALKAMVELMIEKGVFTREEYLAKVRR